MNQWKIAPQPLAGGWLENARKVPSPNQDERPEGEISLLVIHCISLPPGEFGGRHIDRLFCNDLSPDAHPYFREISALKVSAHLLIDRLGGLTQYVPFQRRAWHAGISRFGERERCNDFSIGIELEGTETLPYTRVQYLRLAEVAATLIHHYPQLTPGRIVGHCDIAPGRKTDPGESFDWQLFHDLLSGLIRHPASDESRL